MSSATHATLLEIRSMITQMLGSASDQVRLSSQLSRRVRELPPPDAELCSRPRFDRAAGDTYVANFFELPEDDPQTELIRIPKDAWIRGVNVCVLPSLEFEQTPGPGEFWEQACLRALLNRYGTNWRGLIDLTWRIEDSFAFIEDGMARVRAPAACISGDGEFSADLDWRLKQDQNITVTAVNRLERVLDPECATNIARALPWVAVCFWAEREK